MTYTLKSAVSDAMEKISHTLLENEKNSEKAQINAVEPTDVREAKAKLAELKIEFSKDNPTIQRQVARIEELQRLTREEPTAPPDVREAKANLAELRGFFRTESRGSKGVGQNQGLGTGKWGSEHDFWPNNRRLSSRRSPISNARDVEPVETEIRVRFSKEMAGGSWSWSTAWENSTPEFIGRPYYEFDSQTCVVKVKLEPGRTYAFWLNSDKFQNFKDLEGRPAVPYLLIFQTQQK